MPYPNSIENIKARERRKALQLDCRMGKHKWGPSASPQYERCQYAWCTAIRKVNTQEVILSPVKPVLEEDKGLL